MIILTADQIRKADAYTIKHEPISSIDLMERASRAFVKELLNLFQEPLSVMVVCGTGNNGGDGMAIARLLLEANWTVATVVVGAINEAGGSEDFRVNFDRLKKKLEITRIGEDHQIPEFGSYDILIDSIFGSGLNRPAEGIYNNVIEAMNQSEVPTVAVDIPSGLYSDASSEGCACVQASVTISFQVPKLAFFVPENDRYVGEWLVVDIGLDEDFVSREATSRFYLVSEFIESLIPARRKHTHKGDYGRAAILAGSYGKMGASVLAAKACMRSGVGLLTMMIPECGYDIMQISVSEAMVEVCGNRSIDKSPNLKEEFSAVGIGPGIGTDKHVAEVVRSTLKEMDRPVVMDADAINILASEKGILELVPEGSILTPHPREFERLAGKSRNDFDRLDRLSNFSASNNVYVVLKGAHTAISTPDGAIFFNTTGNPGMATAGSGDVLTGVITSFLAQGQNPFNAAVLGVYLHGLAGDLARDDIGEEGLIASDIVSYLPKAIDSFNSTEGLD